LEFVSFFDPKKPRLSENPASIAQIPAENFEANIPTLYSNTNVTRQRKYYADLYNGSYEVEFKKENTKIFDVYLAAKNFGFTYKKITSTFENDTKNINNLMNIKEEVYNESGFGVVFGDFFGPVLLGVHQEDVRINAKIKTESNSEIIYTSQYYKPTYGIIIPLNLIIINASYQPEITTNFSRNNIIYKKIDYNIPSKSIYGIFLQVKKFKYIVPKFAFDLGEMQLIEGYKALEGVSPRSNRIKGQLASLNIFDTFGVTVAQREYPLGRLQVKKRFAKLNINYLGQWNFGYNEISVTDITGKNLGFKYPSFSVVFDFEITSTRCDIWKSGMPTNCDIESQDVEDVEDEDIDEFVDNVLMD